MTLHAKTSPDFQSAAARLLSEAIPPAQKEVGQAHYPALFLSDLHLGAHSCQADSIREFLSAHWADKIYLVGDIVDIWRPIGSTWRESHHQILRELLARARSGVKIVYTPGNHDAFFRNYFGSYFEAIEIIDRVIHEASDGKRYLVVHGDCCDNLEQRLPYLSKLGAHCESLALTTQHLVNRVVTQMGREEWYGPELAIAEVNRLIRGKERFEHRLADLAREYGTDGIICGHYHKPALHSDHGVVYANCGDWTENCSALAENESGALVQINWRPSEGLAGRTARAQSAQEQLA